MCVCVAMGNLVRMPVHVADKQTSQIHASIGHATLEPYSGQSGQIPSPCGRQTGHTYTYTPIQASTGHATLGIKFSSWAIWADSLSMWQTTTLTHIYSHWTCHSGKFILWTIWPDSLSLWQKHLRHAST